MSNFVNREFEQITAMEKAFRNNCDVLSIRSKEGNPDGFDLFVFPDCDLEIQLRWDAFEKMFSNEEFLEMDGPSFGSHMRFLKKGNVTYVADSRF